MGETLGRAFLFGDNVDTDQILPGYAMSYPVEALGRAAMAGSAIPDFATRVQPGDMIFAGGNFGCGSSREQAPTALQQCGVGAVVAKSYARIFRRNAINIGLYVLTSPDIARLLTETHADDRFSIELERWQLVNQTQGLCYALDPLPKTSLETLSAGGLIERVKAKLNKQAR